MKDIQSPVKDEKRYQDAPKDPGFAMPEGIRRERKPPYDRETGYREEQGDQPGKPAA
jgi:hypothetical protein